MNFVILNGHVGQDPQVKTLDSGRKVMQFTMATTSRYQDANKKWVDEPAVWHNIVAWGHLADLPIQKGSLVEVKGKISNRSYMKDDEKRYVTEIVATHLHIVKVFKKIEGAPITAADDPKYKTGQVDADGFTQPAKVRQEPDSNFFNSDIAASPDDKLPF